MKSEKQAFNRRNFIKTAGTAVVLPAVITSKALGAKDGTPAASDRVTMGGVGCGQRGSSDLHQLLRDNRVQLVAACDVQKKHLDRWANKKKSVRGYTDYRELIARDDIDMIMCGCPDHWHAQVTIDAMKTGKDIYCEKPLTLTIGEGRKIVNTARKYGRVFSCGSQRVIGDYGRLACAANSGRYGKILRVHTAPGGPPRMCYLPGKGNPKDDGMLDWDMWLGPAPWAPYHPWRCSRAYGLGGKGFRSWYDYSGGMQTDWGGHKYGAALHGIKMDHTGPTHIYKPGGKPDGSNKFRMMVFRNGMELVDGGSGTVTYMCEEGEAKLYKGMSGPPPGLRWYEGEARSPHQDVVNCILERRRPFRDVEYAHRVATVCHLMNICIFLDRNLQWDPDREVFVDDEEANRLVDRPRRGPWQI